MDPQVVVVAEDAGATEAIHTAFADLHVRTERVMPEGAGSEARRFEYVFVDVDLLQGGFDDARDGLQQCRRRFPGARIIVMAAPERIRQAVGFVRDGASDYLTYPVLAEEVQLVRDSIQRQERFRSELTYLRTRLLQAELGDPMRCNSDAMKAVLHKVRQVAPTRSTVLLTGETGTGKSLLAKLIHRSSSRSDRQLISVHCGAIPDTLLESELFGHERGAFTGAVRRKLGKFEIAHGGTIFLDEVSTISAAMQIKLLHVLQERSFERVGGETPVEVDVRIIAATNMDLKRRTDEGSFRTDLFYRLNVFPIDLPPLRQRQDDIPLLVETFLGRLGSQYNKEIRAVHPEVMQAFCSYSWPGNVRELENLMERAFILEMSPVLTPENFPDELFRSGRPVSRVSVDADGTLAAVRRRAVEETERLYLKEVLSRHGGRIDASARAAGVSVRQLHKLMTRHGLHKEDFRGRGSEPAVPNSGESEAG